MVECILELEIVRASVTYYRDRASSCCSYSYPRYEYQKVSYRRSISKSPTDYGSKDKLEFERKRGRTHRRFSETALMYLAEDYSTQLSNNEPRFIKSSTSLANSRNELDVYAEMNNYLDEESRGRCRRAQSVEMLALGEGEDEAGVEDPLSTVDNINLDMIREIQIGK
ncbi:hypothetical protein ACHWQZ_G012449 [Mnemiopsis leidyi]